MPEADARRQQNGGTRAQITPEGPGQAIVCSEKITLIRGFNEAHLSYIILT